tara:strand:+ start:1297 stop:2043 length:747 start_codon:yes stop_codon:yes gene_type:complete
MKQVSRIITNTKQVKFLDANGAEVDGTAEDCRAVGGKFKNRVCVLPATAQVQPSFTANNMSAGQGNNIQLAQNCNVSGNYNEVFGADFATVQGYNSKAIRYGEFVHGFSDKLARAQRSVLIFQGRTTNNTETEIYLGGVDGKRFIVDELHEGVICFESRVVCKRIDSSSTAAMGKFQHATFRVTGGALDRLGIVNKTNHNSGISGWTNDFTAVSATPDYIKATVTGQSSATIDWTVICYINEIRTDAI